MGKYEIANTLGEEILAGRKFRTKDTLEALKQ